MANDVIASIQKEFSLNMMTLLNESKGAKLADYCERETGIEAGDVTFYRITSATVQTTLNNYVDNPTNSGGDVISLVVTPDIYYATIVLSSKQLTKTKLDLKSRFMYTFINALNNAEDANIIATIDANLNTTAVGVIGEALSSTTNFNTLLKSIARVKAKALGNTEHGSDVAVAMAREDWADLFQSDKFTDADYHRISDAQYSLAGGMLIPCESVPSGTTYIIPAKTICFATFKEDTYAEIERLSGKDAWSVVARKSFGSAIFDEEAVNIYVLSSAPTV